MFYSARYGSPWFGFCWFCSVGILDGFFAATGSGDTCKFPIIGVLCTFVVASDSEFE